MSKENEENNMYVETIELCPFCGGNFELYETNDAWGRHYFPQCDNSDCLISHLADKPIPRLKRGYKTQKKAKTIWQTRPIEDALRAENMKLILSRMEDAGQLFFLREENEALRERVVELEAFFEHCEYQKDIMGSLSFNTINQYKKRIKELESKLGLDST